MALPCLAGGRRKPACASDTRRFERPGLDLFEDGRMVVGIDGPPPASGQVGNVERINLVADSHGTSYIVVKDRGSSVVARFYVEGADQAFVEFSDYTKDPPCVDALDWPARTTRGEACYHRVFVPASPA